MHTVQSELLWSLTVRHRLFTFSFKRLFLNQLTKFKIILQECSLGGSLSTLFKEFYSMQNFGCHGNKKGEINQNFKNLLVKKYWPDLKIILHKCSLGYLLPRLFKYFRSVEKHGRQGAELIFLIIMCIVKTKNLLVQKYWPDLKIILHKCSLGHP